MEQFNNISVELISAALDGSDICKITSISLCINSVRSTPAQLAEVLLRADTLHDIYLLQSAFRESDALSVQLFKELAG